MEKETNDNTIEEVPEKKRGTALKAQAGTLQDDAK